MSQSTRVIPSPQRRVKKDAAPPIPPTEGGCHFYIRKKNRYCKMVPGKNQKYCGEHIMSERGEEVPVAKIRVPCPIDPTHTCFQNKLQKHIKICNGRLEDQPPGFVRNVNAGPENLEIPDKISINDLTPLELKAFVAKVKRLSAIDEADEDFDEGFIDYKEHVALKDELNRTDVSEDGALKHARQQASILGHMEDASLLSDGNCFVEMGAGRGHINHWIQRALGNDTNSKFVLVDRQGVRYKMDALHRDENEGPKFHRLRMDIQHLKLSEVPEINSRQSPIVIVSKHLCGAATDLTLRCCVPKSDETGNDNLDRNVIDENAGSTPPEMGRREAIGDLDSRSSQSRVTGVVIALCCHHRVDYRSYVGHSYLSSRGFAPREFWLLRSLSSWATCGFENPKKSTAEGEEVEEEKGDREKDEEKEGVSVDDVVAENLKANEDESASPNSTENVHDVTKADFRKQWDWYYQMAIAERSDIGRKCKRLLDEGRRSYIQSHRPNDAVRFVKYVDSSTSLENVLLLVHEKK